MLSDRLLKELNLLRTLYATILEQNRLRELQSGPTFDALTWPEQRKFVKLNRGKRSRAWVQHQIALEAIAAYQQRNASTLGEELADRLGGVRSQSVTPTKVHDLVCEGCGLTWSVGTKQCSCFHERFYQVTGPAVSTRTPTDRAIPVAAPASMKPCPDCGNYMTQGGACLWCRDAEKFRKETP